MNSTLLRPSNTTNKPLERFLKAAIIMVLLVMGNIGDVKAQVYTYQVDQLPITPAFSLLAGKTNPFATTGSYDNGVTAAIPLPFTFQFNGANQSNIYISVNGFATFGSAPALAEITPISSAVGYTGVISPYGCDLDVITASAVHTVGYATTGVVGSRIFKIEWHVNRSNNPATAAGLDTAGINLIFQAWLYETTNVIEFHYNTITPSSVTPTNGQVGLRGANNTDFRNLNWATNTNWPTLPTTMVTSSQPSIPAEVGYAARLKGSGLGSANIVAGANRTFRFTPVNCFAPTGVTASLVTNSTATISWTAPSTPPSNGYQYEIRTSGAGGSGAAGLTTSGSVGAGVLSAPITGLASGTTYYVYVRSDCGGFSAWTSVISFTTGCTPVNIPYFNYIDPFDGFVVPALPPCTTIQNIGTGNNWITETPASGDGTFFDEHLVYNASGSQAANVWWYTNGINLVAGTTYRLSYEYGGSTDFSFITNKLQVAYGAAPANAAMTTTLANHPNIKASPVPNVVNFTAPSTGVFYFGFRAYSAANQGQLYLDNIEIVPSICLNPISVQVSNITGNSALLSWTAPSPVPAGGYAYYVSTSPTPPAYDQAPSGFTSAGTTVVSLTGLTGLTDYYFWVRGNCTGGDFSQWEQLIVNPGAIDHFTTLVNPVYTYCTPAPTSVDNVGITNVTFGTVNNSSGDEPGHYGNYSSLVSNTPQGATISVAITFNTGTFNYNTKIWIDWNNDSDFADAGENVYTGLSASSSPNTLIATFVVPGGASLGQHRMRIGGADIDTLAGFGAGQGPCYNGAWGTFEDYTVNVVVPPPALTLNISTSTQCATTNSPLVTITSPLSNFDTYSWSPTGGVSGDPVSGYTFNPASTTTYVLSGIQTSLPFSTNNVSFTYVANARPTPITITPATAATCQSGGTPAMLTASGGVVSNLPIYFEDFNGAAPGWTTSFAASTGGTPANSQWTLRPDGYVPTGPSWFGTVLHSNDNTGMYFSDSDSQGIGSNTNIQLVSPVIDLTGYTAASLSFWHYYKSWTPSTATVQLSTDGGVTWPVTLQTYTNVTQGTPTAFVNVISDLNAYVGMNNLKIRFNYVATWGWGWAIDNFVVSGSATSSITWTPAAGLYTNAAGTIPYVAGTGTNVVYAMPSADQTYTASASTPMPTVCTTSATASITVTPILAGTASSAQTICNGTASDLTLTGTTGTITGWEYATTAAFTTPIAIPSSASATLTSAQMGTISANRWFRAVVTNGTCTAYSNIVQISVSSTSWTLGAWTNGVPNATKAAIFNGNYNSTGNLNACSVVINSGNVVFNSGHSLIVQNGVTKLGGSLTFNDDASLVQVNDAAVNSGTITYRRNTTAMIQYDYTYWSSPLSPQTLVGLSPLTAADKYFQFNTASNQYQMVPSNSLMVPGKGYIIRAPNNYNATPTIFNGIFDGGDVFNPNDGVPNNGVITIPIIGPGPNNFNLIGNPYPSALDADLFLTLPSNDAITEATLYFWTHNTAIDPYQYTGSDYAIYNLTGGVGTGVGTAGGGLGNSNIPTRYIASGQGFFIKGSANGNATFNNSMRVSGNNANFYRVSQANASPETWDKNRVWLEMKNSDATKYKQTLVGYIETATNEKDTNFDGSMVEAGNPISLYSVLGEDKLGIQGRALPFDVNDQVPIGYRSSIAGDFVINLSDYDGLFATQDIYLEDKVLNVIHDLKSGSYPFTTAVGSFEDRFVLRYTNSSLGVNNPIFDENSVVVYKNDSGIHINTGNTLMASVKIFDIRGRLIFDKKGINNNETVITNLNAEEQVLLVQITSDDNRVVTKKIVY